MWVASPGPLPPRTRRDHPAGEEAIVFVFQLRLDIGDGDRPSRVGVPGVEDQPTAKPERGEVNQNDPVLVYVHAPLSTPLNLTKPITIQVNLRRTTMARSNRHVSGGRSSLA
jgi:hypothetical protein